MIFQAHKGVSSEYPENTMPAFEAAIAQGYGIIELDVSVTRDGTPVLLHDETINRVARNRDGSEIGDAIRISQITYEQALAYDFGIHMGAQFAGTPIARFDEVLSLAQRSGVRLKIDNKYQRFDAQTKSMLFKMLEPYTQTAMLTCRDLAGIREAAEQFPDMCMHYDGPVTDETLRELAQILPKERLFVWLPIQNALTTWVKVAFADEVLAKKVKSVAQLGVWILAQQEEAAYARALGADAIETNGQVKPCGESVG